MRAVMVVLTLLLMAVAGCQTKYTEFDGYQGVSAYAMGSNQYRITARGNAFTDQNVVFDMIMLKSAETAIAAGYSHFAVLGASDNSISTASASPGYFIGSGAYTAYVPGQVYTSTAPGADVMIMVGNLKPGYQLGNGLFDARETVAAISPRIQRPGQKPS